MNNCTTLHETVIRDLVEVISDFSKSDSLKVFNNKHSFKSVAKASSNLVLVFPTMISTNVGIEEGIMIMKSHERKCAVMLQMLFSALCIDDSESVLSYLKNFHTNMDMNGDDINVGTFMAAMDDIAAAQESAGVNIDRGFYEAIKEDMFNLNYHLPLKYLNETSINQYRVMSKDGRFKECKVLLPVGEGRDYTSQAKNRNDALKSNVETHQKRILDTDIKKANELLPTMMVIHFISTSLGPTNNPIPVDAVIGIKAKLYPVDSSEVLERLVSRNKDNNGFHNFLRASTREISFWKDFVFAIDKAKVDALSSSRKGMEAKAWRLLERRAIKSRVRRSLGMANDATAITSLIISQEEADILKKEHNLDIMKLGTIKPIMDAYNLMAIMVVNSTVETVKFLYDDDSNAYETLSFRSLERDASDQSYKKIVNLMTKMNR